MEDEIKLNDPNNLNPDLTKLKEVVEDKTPSTHVLQKRKDFINTYYPQLNKEDKKKVIDNWNEKPEVKENGIKAINKKSYTWLKILAIVGIVTLLVIIFSGAIIGITLWKDGTLNSPVSQICGNVNVSVGATQCATIPSCPQIEIPRCPECNNICEPQIKVYTNGTT